MQGIRDEDRGYNTRVFRITSVVLGSTLEICIGKKYEEGDGDRYNVYRVSNGAVGGLIGHYDTARDEPVEDESGDFNVSTYGEPKWTISSVKKAIPKEHKEAKEVKEPKEPKKEPKSKESMFKVIITQSKGDCFYDTAVRALYGTDNYDEEKTTKLREEIANYISEERAADLVERYKACIGTNTLRDDSYYGKYWDMCLDDKRAVKNRKGKDIISFEDVKLLVIEDIKNDPELKSKINPDLIAESTDLTQPSPNDELNEDCEYFIKDYFNNDKDIEDEFKLLDIYHASLVTPNVWADDFSITSLEMLKNLKFLPMTKTGPRVEDYTLSLETSPEVPNEKTRFILVDYDPRTHYKLIEMIPNKRTFTFKELPELIKEKCKHLGWYIAMIRDRGNEPEPPPEPVPPINPDINRMSLAELKAYAKEKNLKFNSDIKSKADMIKCIQTPDAVECVPKRKTKKGGLSGTKFTRRK